MNSEQIMGRYSKYVFLIMDTADRVMRILDEKQLESLKKEMIRVLINRKTFHKFRFLGMCFRVAADGTHVMNVDEGHCERCPRRTSKSGKVTYSHNVPEAKLVCENGFCILSERNGWRIRKEITGNRTVN